MYEILEKVITLVRSVRSEDNTRTSALLEAVHKAYVETKKYLESGNHDREQEYVLAELWGIASIKALPVRAELADKYMYKSIRWTDSWKETEQKIEDLSVCIERIEGDIKDLVMGRSPRQSQNLNDELFR